MGDAPIETGNRAASEDRPDAAARRVAELEGEVAALRRALSRAGRDADRAAGRHEGDLAAERAGRAVDGAVGRAGLAAGEAGDEALRLANAELVASRAALRRSEERLRLVLDSASDYAIFATDPDRRVVTWNAGAERLLGWAEGEVVGRSADVIFTPEDREGGAPAAEAARALAEGRAENERWHVRKDGTRFWASGLVMPLRDSAGGPGAPPIGLLKVMRDRTERRLAEEALRARERRLRLLADTAAGLLAAADPDEVLEPVFRLLSEEFGVDISFSYVADEDGGGLSLASCFGLPEESRAGFARLAFGETVCGAAAQARRPVHLADASASGDPAAAALRALGVRAYAVFPLFAGGGRLLGTLSFGSRARAGFSEEETGFLGAIAHHVAVVRERLRTEAALRAEEARLRLALDAGRLGAWELDVATGSAAGSPRHDAIFGYTEPPPDWCYETFLRHVLPEDRARVDRSFRAAAEGGAEWHFECRIRRVDNGEARWIEARGRPVLDAQGRTARLLGVVADITERRRDEERRSLLIKELNHRVKNTLAVVQALALQTARGAPDPRSFSAAFQSRLAALARAHDLLTRQHWEGAALVEVAKAALEPAVGGARVDLSACAPEPLLAPAEALAVSMALHELATNALKHGALSVPGGRVAVRCDTDPSGGAHVLEWVERGGPPVPGRPARQGFGLRLLQRGLAAQAGLEAELRFEPEGVRCTLRLAPASPASAGGD